MRTLLKIQLKDILRKNRSPLRPYVTSIKKILFNFSASINGGGLKRLEEYSKWFNEVGGSKFIVSSKL